MDTKPLYIMHNTVYIKWPIYKELMECDFHVILHSICCYITVNHGMTKTIADGFSSTI